jgi:hypothetical protein
LKGLLTFRHGVLLAIEAGNSGWHVVAEHYKRSGSDLPMRIDEPVRKRNRICSRLIAAGEMLFCEWLKNRHNTVDNGAASVHTFVCCLLLTYWYAAVFISRSYRLKYAA